MDTHSTRWLSIMVLHCPACDAVVTLDENELIVGHDQLTDPQRRCEASNEKATVPKFERGRPYACEVCGARTQTNVKNGKVYIHPLGRGIPACSNSGQARGPVGIEVTLRLTVEVDSTTRMSMPVAKPPADKTRDSVRTLSGGAPGLGKRH